MITQGQRSGATSRRAIAVGAVVVGAWTGALSCSGEGPTAPQLANVSISLGTSTLEVGQTASASAILRDATGAPMNGLAVAWLSSNPVVASVSGGGLVSALAPGSAEISATAQGVTGRATITVVPVPVASVELSLASATLTVGTSTQATAITRDAGGSVLAGRAIAWASDNTAVATVSASGVVEGVSPGSAVISAASEAKKGTATVTVTPIPVASIRVTLDHGTITAVDSARAVAVPLDAAGRELAGRIVQWTSSDTTVATVSSAGAIAAVAAGTSLITAASEGKSGTASLTVQPAPVATVSVSLAATSMLVGQSTQATATLRDLRGRALTDREITWTATPEGVVAVSPSGVVAATGEGLATITAASEGRTGTATLTSAPVPVAAIEVSLASSTVIAGFTAQATATLRDSAGGVLTGRAVQWSSSDGHVATVAQDGAVTAVAPGTANITASREGRSASAVLTVLRVPVATVSVALADASITAVGSTRATVSLRDARGKELTGRESAWSSSDPAVATISADGTISGVHAGTTFIAASSEGQTDSATLTVTPAPVASVTVALAPAAVSERQPSQATATLRDARGDVLANRPIAWRSDNDAVATITEAGTIVTHAVGTATITATSEGVSGNAVLRVAPAPVASVRVTLSASTIPLGDTAHAEAVTRDADDVVLSGRAVTWTSDNVAIATVSPSGVIATFGVGTATVTAASEGKSGSAAITVIPAPVATVEVTLAASSVTAVGATQATATLRDVRRNVLPGRAIEWSSSDPSVATISADGAVTAMLEGTTTITATSEGASGTAVLSVVRAPVASVAVSLTRGSILAGEGSQATATLRDARARVLAGRAVAWASDAPGIATISAAGVITSVVPGTATISATSEGMRGEAILHVVPVPVANVTIVVTPARLAAGDTAQATATVLDSANNPLAGRVVSWSSDAPAIATVDASGVVATLTPGTVTITVTSEGRSASATLSVIPPPVASVALELASARVIAGQSTRATAITKSARGHVLQGRAIAWATDQPAVATVDTDGVVTGVAPGVANVSATSEDHSASATVTIVPVPVATVAVSLASTSLIEGRATQASAVTLDSVGHALAGRVVTWSSDNTAVATVSSSGAVTTLTPGTAHVIAESEGITGSATLAVLPVPVARVDVTLGTETIHAGLTTTATAAVYDSAGNQLLNRTVEWSSDNPNVASVSSTGRISAHFQGIAEIGATTGGVTGSRALTVTPAPIASVTVTLASTVLDVGQGTSAAVVLHDSLGNVLTERLVTWSSDNVAVATVSATGVVSATGPGSARIIASSEGESGGALLTVTSPGQSAEPAGMSPLTQRSFDALEEDGWMTTDPSRLYYTIASDPTAPRSPSHVGQIRYPAGWLGGDSPGLTGRDLGNATTIYLSMWVKLSPNWVGHPTGTNKIIHLWISHINRVYLVADGSDANALTPRIGLQRIAGSYDNGFGTIGDALDLRPNLPGQLDVEIVRGRWHHWEVVLTSNTDGLPNGTVDWWLDGVHVGQYTGIPFVDATETRTWDYIGFDPTWGGRDGMLDQEQSIFMDHIYVSGKP